MEQIGTASGGHPNLNLTPEEKRVYGNLLKEADPDGFGAVSGDVAVKFFERTRLPPDVLGQIWQIADTDNRGFLGPAGFGVVLRLIGHAQAGRAPSVQIAPSPAPLPKFDTIPGQQPQQAPQPQTFNQPLQQQTPPITQQNTGPPASPTSGPAPVRVPALTSDKVNEYSLLFEKSGAENGALSGFVAKQIFERARLPNEVLGRIWNLADTQGRGTLDVTEFVIAMHLLASYKSGAMRGVPSTLPPGLMDAAARRAPARLSGSQSQGRPTSSAGFPPMQAQYTGMNTGMRPQSPAINRQMATGTPLSAQSTGEPWLINAPDKARFDSVFATVDSAGQGFISGEQAVQFFGNANLPEEVLATVWDLADINSDGVLNREEFAVAMFLIRQQRGSKDGRLPQSLPAALIPPSMRKQVQPSQPQTAPTFEDAPVTKPRSAAEDLFDIDFSNSTASQQPPVQQIPQSTGGTDPFSNPRSAPATSSSPPPQTLFKPFVPSSSFGRGLTPQVTGAPTQGQTKQASLMDDMDDDVTPARINNDAVELGNLSNQVGNLSNQMQEVHGQKSQAQQELSQTTQQKEAFQQRLTQLRTAYDQEVAQVRSLKEQLGTSQAETKRLQQDMAMIEGTHADLQTQHQQLASALAADQQENTSLKERIRQTNAENEQLKPQLEKLRGDARQQKGLVAINKKQLATNEIERDRLKAELAAIHQEHENHKRETEETARQLETSHRELETHKRETEETAQQLAALKQEVQQARVVPVSVPIPQEASRELQQAREVPLPTPIARELSPPAQIVSPTPSMNSNPFFRRQDSGAVFSPPMGSAITSPAPDHERNNAFDSIFGPSFGSAGPAPTTSFGRDTPENDEFEGPETPRVAEAPAPAPEPANQMDSSALPMRAPLQRGDSFSSSVKPQPPASRLSSAHTPRALTPDTSTASPSSHIADDPFTVPAVNREHEAVRQTLPRGETMEKIESLPGAFPGSGSHTPARSVSNPTAVALGAGVATIAAGAGLAGAAITQADNKATAPEGTKDNFDDIFGAPSHKKTLSEQRADFDSAFANMGNDVRPATPGQAQPARQEFPAIREFDDDDDDDESSDSDEAGPRGFEDDFAVPKHSAAAAGKQPASAAPNLAPPPLESQTSSSVLPGIEAQQSPPDYKDAVPEENPNHFPMEYKNLLPEREDPTSPAPTAGGSVHPGPDPAGAPPAYGPEITPRSPSHTENLTAAPPTSSAPFDFDSAFANMGHAPVADDSDSDYEEHNPAGRRANQPTAFEPTFESPTTSIRTPSTMPQARGGVSIYSAVTAPATNGTSTTSSTGQGQRNFSGFDDFNSNQSPPPRQQTLQSNTATSPTSANQTSSSHDWDALFAPLESQPVSTAAPLPAAAQNTNTSHDAFIGPVDNMIRSPYSQRATETTPGQAATTTAGEVRDMTPPHSSANMPTTSITPSSPTTNTYPSSNQNNLQPKPERPQPGRALSAGTEHDDPILKRLTAMGWSRDQSLDALEKFDYNIDKAADYLTFSS